MSQLMLKVPSATLLSILPTTFSSNNPFTSALMTCFSGVQTQKCNEINTRHVQFTLSATIVIVKVVCFTQVTSFQISTLALKRIKRNHGADRGSKRCRGHVSWQYSVMWIYFFSFYGIVQSWREDRSGLCLGAGIEFQCSKIWHMQSNPAKQHNTLSRTLFKHEDIYTTTAFSTNALFHT